MGKIMDSFAEQTPENFCTAVETQKKDIFKNMDGSSYCTWLASSIEFLKLHGFVKLQSKAEVILNSRKK